MNLYKNRKAYHNYFIEDTFEAGIVLSGSEVKSCVEGHIDLSDAYITIDKGELIMYNSFIAQYNHSGYCKHVEKCKRKLLMHKKEILKLYQEINIKGFTLIPLSFYMNKRGKIKVEIALAKGKHNYDKRNVLKEKTMKKEMNGYK
jgi:SsrA-binding protein